jgi:signal transduction histidine kinase
MVHKFFFDQKAFLTPIQPMRFFKNPTRRIFWLVFTGFLLVTAYFTGWTYYHFCQQAEQSSLLRLEGIANAISLQIDTDLHRRVVQKYRTKDAISYNTQDTDYYKLHYVLARNAVANMLKSPVYTMILDSTQQQFEFVATSSEQPYFRHPYQSFQPILKARYTEGGQIPMYADQFGMWLTAFAPIRDEHGQPVGVLMVDEPFEIFIKKARWTAFKNLLVALAMIIPIIGLLILALQHLLRRETKMTQRLEAAYETNLKISQELEQSYEKLASIDTLRKEMIANISHDLRTPLTNLSGYIETLYMRRHNISLPERERFLTIAQQESNRLKKLIDDLFELSKLESNQIQAHIEPFPIAELVQDILAKYELPCQKQGLSLRTNLSKNTPWVKGDIKLIDRLFQNLLDNALRYNKPDGWIDMSFQKIDNQLLVKIANSSDTIPPSVLNQIFDRYFKNSEIEGSTGLGLAIVKKIADLHAAQLTVESSEGITCFAFLLPVA